MQVLKPDSGGGRFGWLGNIGRGRGSAGDTEALTRLLAPVLDDSYVLVLAPRIPGVDHGLHGLLVGPGGVRALLVRNWHGQFRQRGRLWEFNARGRRGWVACRTDPTRDAKRIVDQVGTWMREALGTQFPIEATIAFPDKRSQVELLDNPVTEVVTLDNAPWWANRLTRIRRLDGRSAGRLLEALGV